MKLIAQVPEPLRKYSPYTVTRILSNDEEHFAYLAFHDEKYYIKIKDEIAEEIRSYWEENKYKPYPKTKELFFIINKTEGQKVYPKLLKFIDSDKIPGLLKDHS